MAPAKARAEQPGIAWIGLGSNIEPAANLRRGLALLAQHMRITAVSPVYETPPWGYADQPPFLNAVAGLAIDRAPEALLDLLQATEQACRRERSIANGPRTLDLDLLLYGDAVIDTPRLQVPHPRLHERAFVLVPLCDVAPEARHPILHETMQTLLQGVSREGIAPSTLALSDMVMADDSAGQ
jgi:2-amino-4-hydroxy-6-hydroxymethyldihydropteridine diphosphokinase